MSFWRDMTRGKRKEGKKEEERQKIKIRVFRAKYK
jgi:hypothetical protein